MKKALNALLIVIISLLAFVACSPEKAVSDELVSATLVSTDRISRSLETEVDFDLSAVKLWKYTARKANGGLTTGQTGDESGTDIDDAVALNSDGTTAKLSQGAWNFVLYGYDASEGGNLICQGSIENATVTVNNHEVTITVKPLQTEGAKGKIIIDQDITITDGATVYKNGEQGYTMSYVVYKTSDTNKTALTNLESVDVGSYTVAITFTGTVNGVSYTAATGTKVINVYAGLTTTVKGAVEETAQAATIKKEGAFVDIKSQTVTEEKLASEGLTVTANSSPVGTESTTAIAFSANSLTLDSTNTNKEVKLTVVSTPVETASTTYSVKNNGSAVAGFDLTLEGATIKDDNSGITITTTISKGLVKENLDIKYVGNSEDTTAKIDSYEPSTGALTFTVYHFSEYVITTNENIAYDEASLRKKISEASTGETATEIKIVDDITLSGTQVIDGGRNVNINLNGHSISAKEKTIQIVNAKAEFSGTGTIQESVVNGYAPILVKGSLTDVADYTVVTIGENVSLVGWSGIFMQYIKDADGNPHSYGIVVNMKGSVTYTGVKYQNDVGIYFNGSVKDTTGNVAVFNLDGAKIKARLGGIYAAGYAVWNIKGDTLIEAESEFGVEIRAGKLNIEGGTFTSNATAFNCTANGSGSTTSGAAIAVAQHTTKIPIEVNISGGTFTGYHALSVMNPQKNAEEYYKTVSVNVTGGSFIATGSVDGNPVSVVKVESEYFSISDDSVYTPTAKFTVTAKSAE